jgi:hypothetical protein
MSKYLLFVLVVAAATMTLRAEEPKQPEKRLPVNVGGTDGNGGATVKGVVRFKGAKPESKPLTEITGNAFCKQCYKDGELPARDNVVFGRNGSDDTLQNVLVYVSKGLEGKKFDVPRQSVILDQVGCVYTPHVVAVMAGQTLEIRNSDATLHNVMSAPRNNPPFNFGMPVKDQKSEKVFKSPEMKMNLKCFMHPWMSSYVHVLEHPFFAVTGPDGTFTIHGLPPGEYELSVLHETSLFEPTPAVAKLTLAAGETKTADFTFQPKNGAR